jgi:N-acetylglutamate synthase-like GNAT family acetyltransferase
LQKTITTLEAHIIPFDRNQPSHFEQFKIINYQWIEKYFKVEELDRLSLENPEAYFLDIGGEILLAVFKGEIVGTAALKPHNPETLELCKMGVTTLAQGLGIGKLILESSIQKARAMGYQKLYLETNSALAPAISLYQKLGFKMLETSKSPYARADVAMEMKL